MIEDFNRINYFQPNIFKEIVKNNKIIDLLDNYLDFCCEQLKIEGKYIIEFATDINNAIASFNNTKEPKSIKLNKYIFEQYKLDISKSSTLSLNALKYSFQLCTAIAHEVKHAKQYELYKNKLEEIYKNIIAPMSNDMLYILQKTEREAFLYELDEMKLLYDYFLQSNLLSQDEVNALDLCIKEQDDYINNTFEKSIEELVKNKLIKNVKDLNINNYEEKIQIYEKIQKLIDRETMFTVERNDNIINKKDYLEKQLSISDKSNLKYKIKNDNGKWNIYLELQNKNNPNLVSKFGFVLDNNECRINTAFMKSIHNNSNEKDILKYVNAFVELYSNEINKIKISDFANNHDYKQTIGFKKQNTKNLLFKKQFILKPNDFTKEDYDLAYNTIKNSLSIDNLIQINTMKNNSNKAIDIEKTQDEYAI